MLTVKHILPSGEERLFSVLDVEYLSNAAGQMCQAAKSGHNPSTGRCRFVFADKRDLDDYYVYEGTVYVMNETGKTVQKYDLGGWALPQATTFGTGVSLAMPPPNPCGDASRAV